MQKITEQDKANKLDELLKDFSEVSLGKKLLNWAARNNVTIKVEPHQYFGIFDKANNCVTISYYADPAESMVALAHELRHAFQHSVVKLDKYDGSFYPAVILNAFAEADALSFQNIFALMAADETGNNQFHKMIDAGFIKVINKLLEQDASIEEFRAGLFKEYFINSNEMRITNEEIYIENLTDLIYQENLSDILRIENKHIYKNLEIKDLRHFGLIGTETDGSNYFDGNIDIKDDLYLGFEIKELDDLVKTAERKLVVKSPRKVVF